MDSGRSKPDPLDKHEGCAEGDTDCVYSTPNLLEHNNQHNQEDHETCPPQLQPKPSGMTPVPHPCSDPSEASEKSSLLPVSPSLLPRRDDIVDPVSSMNMVCPDNPWKCLCEPTKKNGRFEPEEESEMREGLRLMMGADSPCLEFGGRIGTGETQLD